MPIIRQCEEYGLPEPEHTPLPSEERVAEVLKAPTPWSGPMKLAKHDAAPPKWDMLPNSHPARKPFEPFDSLSQHVQPDDVLKDMGRVVQVGGGPSLIKIHTEDGQRHDLPYDYNVRIVGSRNSEDDQ